jgi:hypothetical protein
MFLDLVFPTRLEADFDDRMIPPLNSRFVVSLGSWCERERVLSLV